MTATKRKHTPAFKAQVALAAVKGDQTINEVASQFGVHPKLVGAWKRQLLEASEGVFAPGGKTAPAKETDSAAAELYEQIGRLKMELEWVKKKAAAFL